MCEYAVAFQSFLNYCDQRKNLYRWFKDTTLHTGSVQSFLSIGAGTGEVEEILLKLLNAYTHAAVTLVEPNPTLARQITNRLPSAEVIQARYEDSGLFAGVAGRMYDFVLVSHSIYYLEDPKTVLQECYNMLNTGGTLMIINESVHGIHDFRKRYGGHESMLCSDQTVMDILPGPKACHQRHVIPGHIETRYFQDMLPFILPKFTDEQRSTVRADILEYAQHRYGDYIYQPSVVLITTKN